MLRARVASLWRAFAASGRALLARMWAQIWLPRVATKVSGHSLLQPDDCCVDALRRILDAGRALPSDYPFAAEIKSGVIVYDARNLPLRDEGADNEDSRKALQAEWRRALQDGPGALVVRNAFADDCGAVDEVTAAFTAIAKDEAASNGGLAGDHFAKAGANTRICKRTPMRARNAATTPCL